MEVLIGQAHRSGRRMYIYGEAEALTRQQPPEPKARLRTNLNDAEIKRMAEYVYAKALAWDERTWYGRDELIPAGTERVWSRAAERPEGLTGHSQQAVGRAAGYRWMGTT